MHYANKNGTEKDLLVLNGLPKLFHHKAFRLKKRKADRYNHSCTVYMEEDEDRHPLWQRQGTILAKSTRRR